MLKKSILLGLFLSLFFILPGATQAADWYVNGSLGTDDGSHGTAIDGDAWATLEYALTGSRDLYRGSNRCCCGRRRRKSSNCSKL